MEREYISIEDILASAQNSNKDFSIKGRFLITDVLKKTSKIGKPYYNIKLKDTTGKLNAKRFTSGESEFKFLNTIYLVGNIVEFQGIYQNEWNSLNINTEELILRVMEEFPQRIQKDNVDYFLQENLALINNKLGELIKINKFGTQIHIKSYINDVIKSGFANPSNRRIKLLKKSYEQHTEGWSEDKREKFYNDYTRTIRHYEAMRPSKWKRWGSRLFKLISLIR